MTQQHSSAAREPVRMPQNLAHTDQVAQQAESLLAAARLLLPCLQAGHMVDASTLRTAMVRKRRRTPALRMIGVA